MTLKSYLRMLLAAVTLMFVTTGCNDDEEKVGPPPSYTFGIAVSDVTETEATVTVTPSNDQATYYYGAVKKADFDAFESDAAYAQNILATLKAAADRKVLSLEEYLQTALSKGSSPKKIADLMAGTDYYAVAIGILTDGRFTSDLVKETFKTINAPEPALELTIDVTDITATAAKVSVTSSDETSPYYFDLLDEEDYQLYGGTPEGITEFISELWAFYQTQYPTLTLPQILSQIVSIGNDSYDFDGLTPAAKYYTFAIGVDATTGAATTTAVVKEFTTQAGGGGEGPELKLTMTVGDKDGNNRTTNVYVVAQSSAATSASYWLSLTSTVEQKLAAGETYESIAAGGNAFPAEWMKGLNGAGIGLDYDKCQPGESWTMVLKVTDANGNSTVKHVEATTDTGQGGGEGPELTLTMKAGDPDGANLSTSVTCIIKSSGATAAKAGIWTKTTIDKALASGETIESIINNEGNGMAFEGQHLDAVNGPGLPFYNDKASPSTTYITIAKVTDATGKSTIKSATASTESSGESSDAYKAWLGTWTVTSTSSVVNAKPVSFDVVFSEKVANQKYTVSGWGTTIFREDEPVEALFDAESGSFGFANEQEFSTFEQNGKTFAFKYVSVCSYPGGYTVVRGDYIGLLGQLDASKNQANVIGNELTLTDNSKAKVVSMEFFALQVGGNGFGTYPAADGFVDDDYPIGPYTMTRKSASTSMPARKSAVQMGSLMYASKLSSVLSASTVVSAPAKQISVKAQASELNTLSFVRPAVVYEAKISNVANIEKPIGLKKHFIKK